MVSMKNTFLTLFLIPVFAGISQIPAYYSPVDFSKTHLELKADLADLIMSTHTSPTSYSEVWDVLQIADLDPTNSSVVLLMYGYNDVDAINDNDRSRDKTNYGGDEGDWNREHVFPKSLASPDLGTSGPGSDPHNLRASDEDMNGFRGNKKFANGSGNAGDVGSNWYPGDEWRGDAARIIMYMYVRYGNRCLPNAVTVGTNNVIDAGMINLLLEWNANDEVSTFEMNRNNAIQDAIGNRNPFIDNPHIANLIWEGDMATDTWGGLGFETLTTTYHFVAYPNPVANDIFFISTSSKNQIDEIKIFNLQGENVSEIFTQNLSDQYIVNAEGWSSGIYLIQVRIGEAIETRKIIIQ